MGSTFKNNRLIFIDVETTGLDPHKGHRIIEVATKRTKALYRAKGYSDDWIEKRMRGIAIRAELTDEWKNRKVGLEREYAILTAEISKATFGLTPSEYRDLKGWNVKICGIT